MASPNGGDQFVPQFNGQPHGQMPHQQYEQQPNQNGQMPHQQYEQQPNQNGQMPHQQYEQQPNQNGQMPHQQYEQKPNQYSHVTQMKLAVDGSAFTQNGKLQFGQIAVLDEVEQKDWTMETVVSASANGNLLEASFLNLAGAKLGPLIYAAMQARNNN